MSTKKTITVIGLLLLSGFATLGTINLSSSLFKLASQGIDNLNLNNNNLESWLNQSFYEIKNDSWLLETSGYTRMKDESGNNDAYDTNLADVKYSSNGVKLDQELIGPAQNQLKDYEGCLKLTVKNTYSTFGTKSETITSFKKTTCKI